MHEMVKAHRITKTQDMQVWHSVLINRINL